MRLVQNVKNGPILTKSPWFFSQNWTIFDPTKISKLNTLFERPYIFIVLFSTLLCITLYTYMYTHMYRDTH